MNVPSLCPRKVIKTSRPIPTQSLPCISHPSHLRKACSAHVRATMPKHTLTVTRPCGHGRKLDGSPKNCLEVKLEGWLEEMKKGGGVRTHIGVRQDAHSISTSDQPDAGLVEGWCSPHIRNTSPASQQDNITLISAPYQTVVAMLDWLLPVSYRPDISLITV